MKSSPEVSLGPVLVCKSDLVCLHWMLFVLFPCSILKDIWKLLQTKIRKKKITKMMSLIPQGKGRGKGNQQVCGVGKWI